MRICSSEGSVTVAVALLVTSAISLLLLEVFQDDIEVVEPLGPRALVGLDPVVDRLERPAVEPVEPLPPLVAHVDRTDLPQHPQVLRDLRLRQLEQPDELADGALAAGQSVEDLP